MPAISLTYPDDGAVNKKPTVISVRMMGDPLGVRTAMA
jgi:hypothetical protein